MYSFIYFSERSFLSAGTVIPKAQLSYFIDILWSPTHPENTILFLTKWIFIYVPLKIHFSQYLGTIPCANYKTKGQL